ncbi:hypothetical protein VTO42DRAFT_403 [Malbranchea cinnamomea]
MTATVQSLAALLQRSTIEDHEEIIKTCNAILKKSKNDLPTQYVKVVALLKCDRFEDAIRVIEEGGDALKHKAALEWSYALYKVGKLDAAVSVAATAAASGRGRGARHVEAQASYRAENFQRAKEIYEELYKQEDIDGHEQIDLQINKRAVDAQLYWSRQMKKDWDIQRPTGEDLEGFEITYNAACEYIATGQLDEAHLLLKRARELCESSPDLSAEEKEAELLPIVVQQLYVTQKLGKCGDIGPLLEEITVDRIHEPSTKLIARNNLLVAAPQQSNPYLQHKLFRSTPKSTGSDKLFSFQNKTLEWNSHAIDLLVHKYAGVARATEKILSQHSSSTISANINNLSVVNVAAHCKNEKGKACLKHALPLLEKRPHDVGLVLTLVQLYVENNNVSAAISVLESLFQRLEESVSETDQDIRFNPGLVSVLIALYKSQGRRRGIKTELCKAAAHWQQRPRQARSLLRVAASSLLHSSDRSDIQKSSEIFAKLHDMDPSDRIATAGYVASHAVLSPSSAIKSEAEKLSSVQDLVSGIDVTALEEAGIPPVAAVSAVSVSRKRPASTGEQDKRSRKKRVRKSRLPKYYDPNKQPDPERWLPLRDRSTYRPPKGKKGKQKVAERMQGGIVSEEPTAVSSVVSPQQKAQSGSASSKKKKKGKR